MGARRARRESEESWSLSDAADFLILRIDERLGEKRLPEYYTDPVRFVREVIKTEPTREQVEILTSLVDHNHVAVRSGHGIGKTSCLAFAILWFLTTRAENLKLRRRGRLQAGFFADVVVFDPASITDHATYESPHQYATGVQHVFVNGVQVLAGGVPTGATPVRVVRGPGWRGHL